MRLQDQSQDCGPPTLGVDGRFQVPLEKVRFGATVADDEVTESGFIGLPAFGAPVPSGLLIITTFEFGGVFCCDMGKPATGLVPT